MVNKEKALERELTRLRKSQNNSQVDYRRMRKLRKARTEYWKLKKTPSVTVREIPKAKKEKRKSRKKRRLEKRKEEPLPELEVVEEEPELEVIEDEKEKVDLTELADDLDDLYSYDDEIDEEEE
jgi:hypothetical protein